MSAWLRRRMAAVRSRTVRGGRADGRPGVGGHGGRRASRTGHRLGVGEARAVGGVVRHGVAELGGHDRAPDASCWRPGPSPGTMRSCHGVGPGCPVELDLEHPGQAGPRIVTTPPELSPPTPHELPVLLGHLAANDPAIAVRRTLTAPTVVDRMDVGAAWRNRPPRPSPSELPAAKRLSAPDSPMVAVTEMPIVIPRRPRAPGRDSCGCGTTGCTASARVERTAARDRAGRCCCDRPRPSRRTRS